MRTISIIAYIICLIIILMCNVVLVQETPKEKIKILRDKELRTTTIDVVNQWSNYWVIIQVPQHSYQLYIGENIITLNTTCETGYSTISAFGYYNDYKTAKEDGIIGWIYEYNDVEHFPEPVRTFIPRHTYVVEAYQPCYWGFPNEDNCRKR